MGVHANFLRGTFASGPLPNFRRCAEFSRSCSIRISSRDFAGSNALRYFVFSTFLGGTTRTQLGPFARRCAVRIAVFGISDPKLSDNSGVPDREADYPDRAFGEHGRQSIEAPAD